MRPEKGVAAKRAVPEIVIKADRLTLTVEADKEGRMRVNCSSFEMYKVVLPGQVLEMSWQGGQVVVVRRETNKRP